MTEQENKLLISYLFAGFISIISNFLLSYLYGINGSAIAIFLSLATLNILNFYAVFKYLYSDEI